MCFFIRVHRRSSAAIFLLFLTACGYPGPVLPPLLDIPLAVPPFNAIEYGDKIVVQFTLPDLTTEGNPLRNVRLLEVRVGPGISPFNTEIWAETAKSYPVASPAPGQFTKEIPVADWVNKQVVISIRAIGPKGKPAQWATPKLLGVEPPLPEANRGRRPKCRRRSQSHLERDRTEIPHFSRGR